MSKRKIILSIIRLSKGRIERIKLFKLGFLLSQRIKNFYDFVPYKYGPYSFEMDRDLRIMLNKKQIFQDSKTIQLIDNGQNIATHLNKTIPYINTISSEFGRLKTKQLLDHIYSHYPYYTQFSKVKKSSSFEIKTAEISIYTIGYQNLSIDEFINTLVKKGLGIVIDVRNNPSSYKYGFSKFWLEKYLSKFNIEYKSTPELGIPKIYRKSLSGNDLWEKYKEILVSEKAYINEISQILQKKPSVLMCFEETPEQCHRLILSEILREKTKLKVIHLRK
ncbi:MAG: DUF488 domain-containing protein [Candidatus Stahlbacteria bacterium]|nr:DUF488 domain-containing protein [Candidatus Stahlbacteria bacterium]